MVVGFLVGGWYAYQYSVKRWGRLAAISSIAAYTWLGWAYLFGLGALPNMMPGVFVVAAWFNYQAEDAETLGRYRILVIAALLWAAILWHPTAVAMVVAFCFVIGINLLRCLYIGRVTRGQFFRQILVWVVGFLSLIAITEVIYQVLDDRSFIGSWISLLNKTSALKYERYFQPFSFYFALLWERMWLPLVVLVVLWILVVFNLLLSKDQQRGGSIFHLQLRDERCAQLVGIALISLTILSLEKWKFDRVMVAFAPIVVLALVSSAYAAISKLPFQTVLRWLMAAVVILYSLWQFTSDIGVVKEQMKERRAVYSAFYEQVRMLPPGNIAYVGERSFPRSLRPPMYALDRKPVYFAMSETLDTKSSDIKKMRSVGFRYVLVDLADKTPQTKKLRALLIKHRMQRLATYYKGRFELWELRQVK